MWTDFEVKQHYKNMDDTPPKKISILADLTLLSKRKLCEIIGLPFKERKKRDYEEVKIIRNEKYLQVPELLKQGLTDRQIADKLGVKSNDIGKYRRRNNLKCNTLDGRGNVPRCSTCDLHTQSHYGLKSLHMCKGIAFKAHEIRNTSPSWCCKRKSKEGG